MLPNRSDLSNKEPIDAQSDSSLSQRWYALHTRSRFEKVVDAALAEKGFETFLPLASRRSPVGHRRFREAQIPLFPGYTFARFPASRENLHRIRLTAGVARIVGNAWDPVFIPDAEINSLRILVEQKVTCSPMASFAGGQSVMITCGPLKGVSGKILRRRNRRVFAVKIHLLQRSLEVDLSPHDLEALAPAG